MASFLKSKRRFPSYTALVMDKVVAAFTNFNR
jgi:hypothetical protein